MQRIWQAAVLASLLSIPAWSTLLYTDGAINGTFSAYDINESYSDEVTDSFTISSSSTVTGVSNIGLWVFTGDTPETLSWVISTSPDGGGTIEGSGAGVALTKSPFLSDNSFFYDVYSSSFSVSSVVLSAGTYYLELGNAISSEVNAVAWDVSNGSSTADQNGTTSIPAESFQIDGTVNAPEPGSVALSGLGLALLAGLARLRYLKS